MTLYGRKTDFIGTPLYVAVDDEVLVDVDTEVWFDAGATVAVAEGREGVA